MEKAFKDDWFNKEYDLNITKIDQQNPAFSIRRKFVQTWLALLWVLPLRSSWQMQLCAMSKNNWQTKTRCLLSITAMSMKSSAKCLMFYLPLNSFSTLNKIHTPLSFTMEFEDNSKLPFLGMMIIRNGPQLDTKVYVKPTDTGLLPYYQSHVDVKYKHSLLKTILNRAFKLSSNWQFFIKNVNVLKRFLLACIILKPS